MQKTAKYWQIGKAGAVECQLCPRLCVLHEGQRGFCYGRQVCQGQMINTVYGMVSGVAIDPIEKKPLYHFLPGSAILSFGTIGCNLNCKFCQNWQLSRAKDERRLIEEVAPDKMVALAQKEMVPVIAFTYNEPTIFFEYAYDVAQLAREQNIKTVAVTSGYINARPREELYHIIDAANVDLKGFSERFYRQLTGGYLQPVLDTLKYIKQQTSTWLEITNLLIPGENDAETDLYALCEWVVLELGVDVPLHFSAFHPNYQMRDKEPTTQESLLRARRIAKQCGINYIYLGNMMVEDGGTTFCHCGQRLIERSGYNVVTSLLNTSGQCPYCHRVCAGIFV